jgi:hypothetical protein
MRDRDHGGDRHGEERDRDGVALHDAHRRHEVQGVRDEVGDGEPAAEDDVAEDALPASAAAAP